MPNNEFLIFLNKFFHNYYKFTKEGCIIHVCNADTEGENFTKAFRESGFKLSETIIWAKDTFVLGRQDYHWRHEPILYGWKEGAAHYYCNDRTQDMVWEIEHQDRNVDTQIEMLNIQQ